MEALKVNSLFSEVVRNDFVSLQQDFAFLSFYETKPTTKKGFNIGIVVSQQSATQGIPHEVVFSRETDHSGVCTYSKNSINAFNQLVFNLNAIVKGPQRTVNLTTGALVLVAGRGALKQWNFSDTDIATMSGAGRNTGTWITAGFRDRGLLEYNDTRAEDLFTRKGFVEPAKLQERWGSKLRLFKQGNTQIYGTIPKADIDGFTWVMVLIYAALIACTTIANCHEILMDFAVELFDEDAADYLKGELPSHIEGWNSIASVRMITDAAIEKWHQLELYGKHHPGCIPESDSMEISRFLRWLTAATVARFDTASSDHHCLSSILSCLGLTQIVMEDEDEDSLDPLRHDENQLVVVLKKNYVAAINKNQASRRKGVRIPLGINMREAVSPWPLASVNEATPMLMLGDFQDEFSAGERAGKDIDLTLVGLEGMPVTETTNSLNKTDVCYKISSNEGLGQLNHRGLLAELMRKDFFLATKALGKELEQLCGRLGGFGCRDRRLIFTNEIRLARYQCFVLGYYYGALGQLVVDTQLGTKEAFGSWGWWDDAIFQVVEDMRRETPATRHGLTPRLKADQAVFCWRFGVLKVVAYLFVGADLQLIRSPGMLDLRAVGVTAKLCVLTASMVGQAHDPESASKFVLLNINRTCIPNTNGMVMAGTGVSPKPKTFDLSMRVELPVTARILCG